MEQTLRPRRWRLDFHQLGDARYDPDLHLSAESSLWSDVVFSERWPGRPDPRAQHRRASEDAVCHVRGWLYCDRARNLVAEPAGLAIARAVTVESARTIVDAGRTEGMEYPNGRRDCIADSGAGVAKRTARLELLDLFVDGDSRAGLFHVSQTVDGKSVRGVKRKS